MWVKGSFVPKSSRRGALLCDYNGLLLEGDEASAHLKRCEANLSYDTSYLLCSNFARNCAWWTR